ncbi:MAG TPA: class IV adenylate cyclase [Flavisolibacter sp.]|nr:class IV adenylate cyclase [Flavisolibacter sp.]
MHINYEFKAACSNIRAAEQSLLEKAPRYIGTDHQVDTYFHAPYGRLKLREGSIENALIHYDRADTAGARESKVILYQHQPGSSLKRLLTAALGIKVVVDKMRKIYFIDNVKFHFDEVRGLGSFVEVEAIDSDGSIGIAALQQQCNVYAHLLGFSKDEFLSGSYSDMLLAKKSSTG